MTPHELPELLPCPCGRNARISATDSAGRRSASCDDEDCYWSIVAFTDEQLVERWNRRAALAGAGAVAWQVRSAFTGCGWYAWLQAQSEREAVAQVARFKENGIAAEWRGLYAHPAPVAVGVDEAMVERALSAKVRRFTVREIMALRDAETDEQVMRAALIAALEAKPHA